MAYVRCQVLKEMVCNENQAMWGNFLSPQLTSSTSQELFIIFIGVSLSSWNELMLKMN